MSMDLLELKKACHEIAQNIVWDGKLVDVDSIEFVANNFFEEALLFEEIVKSLGYDPNIIVRAVRYLAHSHGMPPMRQDTQRFSDMLSVLIELACPNAKAVEENEEFYCDIEKAITLARSEYREE